MPHLTWQCSDQAEHIEGIQQWLDEAALPNTPVPLVLDVADQPWPAKNRDAVFAANCLHIMSWSEVECFFSGLDAVLLPDARLVIYGPFNYDGAYTSESNARFDAWLKSQAPHRAIRDFEAVNDLAESIGLRLKDDIEMPANNRCLIWGRSCS